MHAKAGCKWRVSASTHHVRAVEHREKARLQRVLSDDEHPARTQDSQHRRQERGELSSASARRKPTSFLISTVLYRVFILT
jgi:hypothetical protein